MAAQAPIMGAGKRAPKLPEIISSSPIAALSALPPGPLAAKWRQLERQWDDLDRMRRLAELFAAFDPRDLELGAELLIAELDARAGDPDIEANGDEEDFSAGDPIEDVPAHWQPREREILRLRWPS